MAQRVALLLLAVVVSGLTMAAQERVYKPGGDVTLPAVVKKVNPAYTKAAQDARIQGVVVMKFVVLDTGNVGDVSVTQSLDDQYGLDDAAVKAVKEWQFKAGTKDGKPVPVEIALEMTFTLK